MGKIQCLTCGGMTDIGQSLSGTCEYCGCAISLKRISSFNGLSAAEIPEIKASLENSSDKEAGNKDLALGVLYLKSGNFTLAKKKFAQVMENAPECCESYYYYAVALINGRDLSQLTMREARQLTEFLQTAMTLDENFIFPKLLYALICIEYYENNDLIPPDDGEALLNEIECEVDAQELAFFKSAISTDLI